MSFRRVLDQARSALGAPPPVPPPVAPGTVLVAASAVVVERSGRTVVDGVDLTVRAGELVVLAGPNGAGKTTLLHALTGDLPAVRGSVAASGRPVAEWPARQLALRRAVLPQQATVSFPFTAEQVVRLGRAPWAGTERSSDDDRLVAAALATTETAHLAARPVPHLSGGERARVALARVLAQDTQLLLLDEPTAALDLHHQELTLSVVRDRVADGAGAVVVLHDLGQAARYADRVVVLDHGRAVADGSPAEVLRPELLSAVYRHPLDVLSHPGHGGLLVVPV